MLARVYRLTHPREIRTVIRQGQLIKTPYVHVYVRSRTSKRNSRVACVVGKKVDKRATKRHQYQRWLREIARDVLSELPTPVDMVWVGQSTLPGVVDYHTLKASLSMLKIAVNQIE